MSLNIVTVSFISIVSLPLPMLISLLFAHPSILVSDGNRAN